MKRILIAEDNPAFADFLATTLRLSGCRVEVVGEGAAAVEKFASGGFDLVFLDVLLPGESGLWACAEIRKLPAGADVPIVVMSGVYRKQGDREEALRQGATESLFKPVGVAEIWRLLEVHLGVSCQAAADSTDTGLPHPSEEWLTCAVDLRERPLAVVLQQLQEEAATGLLFVNDGRLTSIFYIDGGALSFARSNDADQRLGRVLRKLGRITAEQLDAAMKRMKEMPRAGRLGEALVELGYLSREDLHQALQHQLENLIVQAFEARSGCCRFVAGELPSREEIRLELDTDNVILKGIRAMPDENLIHRQLPGGQAVLRVLPTAPARLAKLQLTSFERQVMGLIDGERSLDKIRSFGRLGQVGVDRMLFAFLNTGLVEVVGDGAGEPPAGEDAETDATTGVRVSGELSDKPVPGLLAALHRAEASGVLSLANERHETWLYYDKGRIVFVGSNDTHQRLGETLVEAGLITAEELEEASAEMAARQGEKLRLGQVLLAAGKVTLEELQWSLVFQMQARIQTLFHWDKGEYRFEPGPLPTEEPILLEYDTRDIVLEGVRRMDPYVAYRRLPPVATTLRRAAGWDRTCRELGLMSTERRFLQSLGDEFTLTEPLDSDAFDPELTVKCLLAFLSIGLLWEVAQPEQARTESSAEQHAPVLAGSD